MKTGILVLNFGGPDSLDDLRSFLYRLFSDPYLFKGLKPPLRQAVAYLLASIKAGSSKEMYRSIGGKSPQLQWTKVQADGLRKLYADDKSVRIEIGMRLSEPSIKHALIRLKAWGAERIVALPLFSQYSSVTTGSCFLEVKKSLKDLEWKPESLSIEEWCDHEGYVALLRKTVDEKISAAFAATGELPYVLFSSHSLPMRIVERGDPYLGHVQRTVNAVAKDLTCEWSLAYQSRNGPIAWAKPYVEEEIPRLANLGVKNMVVVPISFVCDHVETLYELDQLYAGLASKAGITGYYRARTFNDDPQFPLVLKSVVTASGYL